MNYYLTYIGKKLPELREIIGWSQSQLCEVIGISRPVICSIENNPEKNNKLFTLALYTIISHEIIVRRRKLKEIDYNLFYTQEIEFINNLEVAFNINKKYLINKNYSMFLESDKLINSRQYEVMKYIINIFENNVRENIEITKDEVRSFVEEIVIEQENRILNCFKLSKLDLEEFINNINPPENEENQIHRTNIKNIITNNYIRKADNREVVGITIEKVICDLFRLERKTYINSRSSKELEMELTPVIQEAFKLLPAAIAHMDLNNIEKKGQQKYDYDFILEGSKTLSIKFNYGQKVSPSVVGQASQKTFLNYFGHLMKQEFSEVAFKRLVLEDVHKMIPIYLNYLLNSDYLLWIYIERDMLNYKILNLEEINKINWKREDFTFTKDTLETWNESTTVKYRGISLGEFQVHRSRNSYKFRFNMKNLLKVLEMEEINLEQ